MKKILSLGLFGILSWLIPFFVSILFYSREGGLLVDIFLFKSIMIVVGSLVGATLLVLYFKKIKKDHVTEGIVVGIFWFVINIVLDVLILLPISGMSFGVYFQQIGLRYLVLPIIAIAMGFSAKHRW
ncbi:hypothetical protein ACFLZX_06600 [Nanoarchaeota archaeon]